MSNVQKYWRGGWTLELHEGDGWVGVVAPNGACSSYSCAIGEGVCGDTVEIPQSIYRWLDSDRVSDIVYEFEKTFKES